MRYIQALPFLLAATALSGTAAADIRVGVVVSLTGPGSSYGTVTKQTYEIAVQEIDGEKVTYYFMDDGSDPSRAVQNVRKMAQEENVDILVGFNGVQIPRAVQPMLAEFNLPAIAGAPLSLSGKDAEWFISVVQPVRNWMIPVVESMASQGVKTVGFIGYADSWGDDTLAALKMAGAEKGIEVIVEERYARGDTTTTPQMLKIFGQRPDAVFVGAGGTGSALPALDLERLGYDGPIYHTNAAATPQFLSVAGTAAEGNFAVTGPLTVADKLADDHPSKALALDFIKRFNDTYSTQGADVIAGYCYDASILFEAAAKKALKVAKPGTPEFRNALRTEMHALTGVVGVTATFGFQEGSSDGVGPESTIIVQAKNSSWEPVK